MSLSSSSRSPARIRRAAGVLVLVGCAYVFAAALSVTTVGRQDQLGGALAALNVGLAAHIGIAALKKRVARRLMALTSLPMLAVSWPLTTLYYAVVEPDARCRTASSSVCCLDGAEWVQCANPGVPAGLRAQNTWNAFCRPTEGVGEWPGHALLPPLAPNARSGAGCGGRFFHEAAPRPAPGRHWRGYGRKTACGSRTIALMGWPC